MERREISETIFFGYDKCELILVELVILDESIISKEISPILF